MMDNVENFLQEISELQVNVVKMMVAEMYVITLHKLLLTNKKEIITEDSNVYPKIWVVV